MDTVPLAVLSYDKKTTKVHEVPVWAKCVARDESGKLWAYENKPTQSPESADYSLGFWFPNVAGGNIREIENPVIGRQRACPHWRETLQEIPCPLK